MAKQLKYTLSIVDLTNVQKMPKIVSILQDINVP
jgi:hypothetical protein